MPPGDQFYFPTGLLHAASGSSEEGVLFVASSNFDRKFDYGTLMAVDLGALHKDSLLPAFPVPLTEQAPQHVSDLRLTGDQYLLVGTFAGDLAGFKLTNGGMRLFLPSRVEGSPLQMIDVSAPETKITCYGQPDTVKNCVPSSPSLTAVHGAVDDLPRMPSASGVAVSQERQEAYITHLASADSPLGARTNFSSYMLRLSANEPEVSSQQFVPIGSAGGNTVVVGRRYAYVSGRVFGGLGPTVRLLDLDDSAHVVSPSLETEFKVLEARGLAITQNENRLYLAGRSPDTLLVADIEGAQTKEVQLKIVRGVPLPAGANQVSVLEREGRGNLVLISCSGANRLVVYDDDAGEIIRQIEVTGQPNALVVHRRGAGARIYVGKFEDGQIEILDLPDVNFPELRRAAVLGKSQACILNNQDCGSVK